MVVQMNEKESEDRELRMVEEIEYYLEDQLEDREKLSNKTWKCWKKRKDYTGLTMMKVQLQEWK